MLGLKCLLDGRVPAYKLFRVGIALAVMVSTIAVWSNIAFARDAGSGAFKQTFASPSTGHLFLPYVTYFPDSVSSELALTGDFNHDGRDDVAFVQKSSSPTLYFYLQKPDGGFAAGQQFSLPYGTESAAVGDLNGDQLDDIVLVEGSQAFLVLQRGDGTLSDPSALGLPYNMGAVVVGDFNNDGRDDIAVGGYQSASIFVLYQTVGGVPGSPVEYSITVSGESVTHMGAGDLNHDGKQDLAVLIGSGVEPHVCILIQKDDATMAEAQVYYVGSGRSALAIGDATDDDRDDIVTIESGNGTKLYVAAQRSGGGFSNEVAYDTYNSPSGLVIADVNQDGRLDVAMNHYGRYKIGVYLQNSQGELEPEDLYSSVYGDYHLQSIAVGDLNHDGFPDLVSAYAGLNVLYGINPLNPPTPTATLVPSATPTRSPGQVKRVLLETFDGKFPGKKWNVTPNGWWIADCEKVSGNYSAWGIKKTGAHCGDNYPTNQKNWMIYGPFSLEKGKSADMYFHLWLNAEKGKDSLFVGASYDGKKFYGVSYTGTLGGSATAKLNTEWDPLTNVFSDEPAVDAPEFAPILDTATPDWVTAYFNLSKVYKIGNLAGSKRVFVGFAWRSDKENTLPNGAFVDDVLITKTVKKKK